jgi:hypothetical protein
MVEQPLVLEHDEAKITLSGVRQLLQRLTPEQIKQLEKDLQDVVNRTCALYVGPVPN